MYDFKEIDVEGCVESKFEVCLNVILFVVSKLFFYVVVLLDEGIDDGEEVEDYGDDVEDGVGEFVVVEEEMGWDLGDEEGDEVEEDMEEEVYLEGWVGVGFVGVDFFFWGCCEVIERLFVEVWCGEFFWCWGCYVLICIVGVCEGGFWFGEVVE